ncbi:MAG: hypothetical protein J0M17_08305 [Planctomycetes bacterium]|nr:hypothetical protein [Planctomycetota bacterium]
MAGKTLVVRMSVVEKGADGKGERVVSIKPIEVSAETAAAMAKSSPKTLRLFMVEGAERLSRALSRKLVPPKAATSKK